MAGERKLVTCKQPLFSYSTIIERGHEPYMVFVISKTGTRLMPTSEYRARRLLKKEKAIIYKYRPFTIKLTDRADGNVQPIEYKCDTGYNHVGVSICTEKRELVNAQFDLLSDEVEHHNDCRKYRRTRRNRLRYRKPRFDNRAIPEGWFAPSLRNKRDRQTDIFKRYYDVMPITTAFFEMGQFDTQVLKAVEAGLPLPEGADYQHGEQYGFETLRQAVFNRDSYTCICCGRSAFKDKAILHVHHLGFKSGDRTNRMANLATVCEKCHTSSNHQPGGRLYDLRPKLKDFRGATFMTTIRYSMLNELKAVAPDIDVNVTYGAETKLSRKQLDVKKTHSNDAWCMGTFHPKYRTDFMHYVKRRRNNRVLEKFYDAKFLDTRDHKTKSGSQLSCNRTKRNIPRNNPESLRMYRGHKTAKGRRSIRRIRYSLQPGDIVSFNGRKYIVNGCQHYGEYVSLKGISKAPKVKCVIPVKHTGGWQIII